jgi:hypothetical protein
MNRVNKVEPVDTRQHSAYSSVKTQSSPEYSSAASSSEWSPSSLTTTNTKNNDLSQQDSARSYVGCSAALKPLTARLMGYTGRPRSPRSTVVPRLHSTIKLRRRRDDLYDATYDVDADGVISPADVAYAHFFDVNHDGFLTKEELVDGRKILMDQFYDRNKLRMWKYGPNVSSLSKEEMVEKFSHSSDFAALYKKLTDSEQRLTLGGSEGAMECLKSPIDAFDPPPTPVATYVMDNTTNKMTRVNSRDQLWALRRQERANFLQNQYDAVNSKMVVYDNKIKHHISFLVESPVKGKKLAPLETSRGVYATK